MKLISSEEFSKKCDFILCPLYNKNINLPQKTPKRIFITGEQGVFDSCIHNGILKNFDEKYELVYHRTDRTFDRFDLECIKPYVSHIWAENCEINHPMITRLPLGFSDKNKPKRLDFKKDILCYVNIGLPTTDEFKFIRYKSLRMDCLKHFSNKSWCTIDEKIPFEEFNEKMNRSKFVVCPMGFGIDTHRFYESVWLGCTPIVMSSGLDELYKKYNALIVNSWEEVTEELLINHVHKPVPDELFDVNYFLKCLPQ